MLVKYLKYWVLKLCTKIKPSTLCPCFLIELEFPFNNLYEKIN